MAVNATHDILGVAAWKDADPKDLPDGQMAMLLHGIYVAPEFHHQGIGQQLFHYMEKTIALQGYDGVLVKAQADGFFLRLGMQRLSIENEKRDYANRF